MPPFQSAIKKLEFDRILHRISQLASSDPGRERAHQLFPKGSPDDVVAELQKVTDAKELLIQEGGVPLDGVKNITPQLKKTSIANAVLSAEELLNICSTLQASRLMKTYLGKKRPERTSLQDLQNSLLVDKVIEYNISQAIDEHARVRDSASKQLRTIRREIVDVSSQLRDRLAAILKRVSEMEFLQEEIVTTRDGRMVIPVKTEFKRNVPGFIHSTSASGATTFIEPAETLELNNRLRELHIEEQREIDRILRELTEQVREIGPPLQVALGALSDLDVIFARAKYSVELIGCAPVVVNDVRLQLVDARHPGLLMRHRRDEVVPLNVSLGGNVRSLVITGPNAGGKSVALKTIGLLALCVQAGIHISASDASEFCIFDDIFVDIGDDQSIEHDLSTYSSHLVNLRDIVQNASGKSLVLMDEIGAGTDPEEGGALAISILTELGQRGSITVSTTHLGMLKAFVHQAEGMMNGSMEFDQQHLRPTYRFVAGIPGSSYAIELAERMGLPSQTVHRAKSYLGAEKVNLEELLLDLARRSQKYDQQLSALAKERSQTTALLQEYQKKMDEVRKETKEIQREAMRKAEDIVARAQVTVEKVVKEIKEQRATSISIKQAKAAIQQTREQLQTEQEQMAPRSDAALQVGDFVLMPGSTEVGEISEIKGNHATVLWRHGILRVRVSTLQKTDKKKAETDRRSVFDLPLQAQSEIDLRGMTGDEAVQKVEHFIDDAYVSGLKKVSIIHGKGTGTLRKRIAELLQQYRYVRSFRLGEWNEGGSGVTVVELHDK